MWQYILLCSMCFLEEAKKDMENYARTIIKALIMAGDKDSLIKAKVAAQLMALGFSVDDMDDLEAEIVLIRENIETEGLLE